MSLKMFPSQVCAASTDRSPQISPSGSTALREYLWNPERPLAVVEGGAVFYIRADNINRPAFATNASGVKMWSASYLPFGGVSTSTGTPITLRFPGQWFELESNLHQNWMRDYDPTTGRYLQADPLGLVDGAAIYGYAGQSPLRNIDIRGESFGGIAALTSASADQYDDNTSNSETGVGDICMAKGPTCIESCSALALPTSNYGISFQRCMLACESKGRSGFDEWDQHFW